MKIQWSPARSLLAILLLIGATPHLVHAQAPGPEGSSSGGQVYIDIGAAQVKKSLLAMPMFQYSGTAPDNIDNIAIGQKLFDTAKNNLTVSNYFEFIKPEAFLEDPRKTGLKPAPGTPGGFSFKNWQTVGAEFLIRGGYRLQGQKISFEVYLYHVGQAKLILGKTYEAETSLVKRVAHQFANDVLKALTGTQGFFLTKMVAAGRAKFTGPKEIYLMDWDGENRQQISDHKSVAISPAWSPKGDLIAYSAFSYHKNIKSRNADLYLYNLTNRRRSLVSYERGINSGANFLPSGTELFLTLSQGGSPDIFIVGIDGGKKRQVTRGPGRSMNVEPVISPDGQRIAFSSDRGGSPDIYVMNIDGSGLKRLTFAKPEGRRLGYNSSPTWSPDGKKIAFSGNDKTHFDIFIMNADGTEMKRLTSATKRNGKPADNRDPSFSPDGRQIAFSSNRTGNRQIYMVDPEGDYERRLTNDDFEWEQPRWSPFLD